jgi:hypothetical protein
MGHKANLKLVAGRRADRPSDFDFTLDSDNAKGAIKGTLDPNWVLTLREDGVVTMNITKELSSGLLSAVSILVKDARSDTKPAKLTLSKQGFSAKVYPFDMATVNADATLELNRLIMSSGGWAGQIISALQKAGSKIEARDEFPADFTVAKIEVRNGRITTNDIWFTSDRRDLTMGTKAVAYQVKDEKTGKMVWYSDTILGISGDTATTIPKLAGYVDPNSVIELRAKGKTGDIQIDYAGFATQIALLVGKAEAAQSLGGGKGALAAKGVDILGDVLKNAGGKKARDDGAPTITTTGWPNKPKPVEREAEKPAQPAPAQPDQAQPATPPAAKEPAPKPKSDQEKAIDAVEGILQEIGKKKDK